MPAKPGTKERKHLRRLDRVFADLPGPVYYLTGCVLARKRILDNSTMAVILVAAWKTSPDIYGWAVGRYVIMPDHVHFFVTPWREEAQPLSRFVGGWKRWTRHQAREHNMFLRWQDEFFDHVLRTEESYAQKWEYVRQNPVRAGLVSKPEDWPYQGEIVIF